MSSTRVCTESSAPAAGGGPWNVYSCPPWSRRRRSSFTWLNTDCPGGDQNETVVRNVGGIGATGPSRYSGADDIVARAHSRIFPRSTGIVSGAAVAPIAELLGLRQLGSRVLPHDHVARLLRHAAGDLAAACRDRRLGVLARQLLETTGEHEREPGEDRLQVGRLGLGSLQRDAGGAQLLHQRAVR